MSAAEDGMWPWADTYKEPLQFAITTATTTFALLLRLNETVGPLWKYAPPPER